MCGSGSILINTYVLNEEGSSAQYTLALMFQSLIGNQKYYTEILNDPVPQDYTRDIPDI